MSQQDPKPNLKATDVGLSLTSVKSVMSGELDPANTLASIKRALDLATGKDVLAEQKRQQALFIEAMKPDPLGDIDKIQFALDIASGKNALADMEARHQVMMAALEPPPYADTLKQIVANDLAKGPEQLAALTAKHQAILASTASHPLDKYKIEIAAYDAARETLRAQQQEHNEKFKAAMGRDPFAEIERQQAALDSAVKKSITALQPAPLPAPRIQLGVKQQVRKAESPALSSVADLGRIVHDKRKDMKLTQQQFADLTGVGRRFILELEAGKPTLEFGRILKVCQAVGIDLMAVKR